MSRQIARKAPKPVVFWYPPWNCWTCRQPYRGPNGTMWGTDGDTPLEAIKAFFKNNLHKGNPA